MLFKWLKAKFPKYVKKMRWQLNIDFMLLYQKFDKNLQL